MITEVNLSTGSVITREYTAAELAAIAAQPAPVAQPLRCNARQIRGALTQAGLRAQVETAVTASTDQNLKDAWNYGQIFVENDPLVLAMSAVLSQSPAQIHALFQLAQTLAP